MKEHSENKPTPRENFWKNLKESLTNVEMKVICLLFILMILGIVYNIVSYHFDKPVNLNICPLCEEPTNHVIYEQRNKTYTF